MQRPDGARPGLTDLVRRAMARTGRCRWRGLLSGDYGPSGHPPWQLPRSLDQVLRPGGTDVPADATDSGPSTR